MKRILAILLLAGILVCLVCCASRDEELQLPAKFYYPNKEIHYGAEDGVISCELREAVQLQGDLYALLQLYLQGPRSPSMERAVPESVALEDVVIDGQTITVRFSSGFSQLSGLDLSMACSCVSLTLLEYTNLQQVRITAADSVEGDSDYIVMTRDNIILTANVPEETK